MINVTISVRKPVHWNNGHPYVCVGRGVRKYLSHNYARNRSHVDGAISSSVLTCVNESNAVNELPKLNKSGLKNKIGIEVVSEKK